MDIDVVRGHAPLIYRWYDQGMDSVTMAGSQSESAVGIRQVTQNRMEYLLPSNPG